MTLTTLTIKAIIAGVEGFFYPFILVYETLLAIRGLKGNSF